MKIECGYCGEFIDETENVCYNCLAFLDKEQIPKKGIIKNTKESSNYKIYIIGVDNFPIFDWALSAYIGFKEKGANIILFEDITEVPVSKNNIVIADIDATHKYLSRFGINCPKALNIPEELSSFTEREIRYMTMEEFKKDKKLPIFIKGNNYAKEYSNIFGAGVITKEESRNSFFNGVPDEFPVLVSEVLDIISEYRCYIIDGELKGIKHYLGDIRIFPDIKIIDSAISKYKSQPCGYSMDFGVTSDGKTVLIECNDGYSLGNYGLEPDLYSTLLAKRWREIISSSNQK